MYPLIKLSAALAARAPAAIMGAPGAIVRKAPNVAVLAANNPVLRICRPGITLGREAMRPASLRNATIDPVNVTPPCAKS